MNDTLIEIVIGVIVIGYLGFGTYKSLKRYLAYKTNLDTYTSRHKEASLWKLSPVLSILLAITDVVCIVIAIFVDKIYTQQVGYYRIIFIGFAVLMIGLIFESYMRRRVYFADDGFYFDGGAYRYRMITDFKIRKSIGRTVRVHFADNKTLDVPKAVGIKMEAMYQNYKEQKKKSL